MLIMTYLVLIVIFSLIVGLCIFARLSDRWTEEQPKLNLSKISPEIMLAIHSGVPCDFGCFSTPELLTEEKSPETDEIIPALNISEKSTTAHINRDLASKVKITDDSSVGLYVDILFVDGSSTKFNIPDEAVLTRAKEIARANHQSYSDTQLQPKKITYPELETAMGGLNKAIEIHHNAMQELHKIYLNSR